MYKPIKPNSKGKYGSNYWETYSPKLKRDVSLYSDLEYDHWALIEGNPSVKEFCEQPERVSAYYNGKKVNSVIDMWVQYKNGVEEFIEVKYTRDLYLNNKNSLRNIRQVTVQEHWCKDNGFSYKIMTEKEIRRNKILLDNLKYIIANVKTRESPVETDRLRVIKYISEKGRVTLKYLKLSFIEIDYSRLLEAICVLIYQGILDSNIDRKMISYDTEVWLNAKDEDH